MPKIEDARILIMATHGFEQSELVEPLDRLKAKGATVHVAAPEAGEIKGWKEKNWGDSVPVDVAIPSVEADSYDALVLPGGQMNPDILRLDRKALAVIGAMLDRGLNWVVEPGVFRVLIGTSSEDIRLRSEFSVR